MQNAQKGIDIFTVKILALVLMTFDHIHEFFIGIYAVPAWFTLLGRISAPLFIFAVANGFRHTRSREKYMLRLYLWSVFMAGADLIANMYFRAPNGAMVINNIFATMFYIVYYLYFLDKFAKAVRGRRGWGAALSAVGLVLPIVLTGLILGLAGVVNGNASLLTLFRVLMCVLPTPMLVEGGPVWIALGIGLYYLMDKKGWLSLFYLALCGLFFVKAAMGGLTLQNLFVRDQQWFMVFALPVMLLYNGRKGPGMKNFFYIYYPAHIFGLLALSHLLA